MKKFKNKICQLTKNGMLEFLVKNIDEGTLSITSFKKINEILNEDEIISELKKFVKSGGEVFIRLHSFIYDNERAVSLSIELKYNKQKIYIDNIPASFYNKLLNENFPIAENNDYFYQDMRACSKVIELYNNLSDEEKLRIELGE